MMPISTNAQTGKLTENNPKTGIFTGQFSGRDMTKTYPFKSSLVK